ncbi:MAG: 6-bladed beta-propeller [Duncaniella sp.]|nr:6-bladed beta-propeller [Duncaniella sp.]
MIKISRDGKYIGQIGSKGNGPGEYISERILSVLPRISRKSILTVSPTICQLSTMPNPKRAEYSYGTRPTVRVN